MDREEYLNIYLATCHFENICMNISTFTDIMKNHSQELDSVTAVEVLKRGLYAHMWGKKIFVSKTVGANCIRVCKKSDQISVNQINWSNNISLSQSNKSFEKFLKFKEYW